MSMNLFSIGRILIGIYFLLPGIAKVFLFSANLEVVIAKEVPFPIFSLSIVAIAQIICGSFIIFGKHLKTLKGVSRTSSDWVIDSILNPKPKGFSFDISDLLGLATEEGFQFLGSSSPNFFQNYDWYKQFDSQNSCSYNKKVKSSWERQVLCTLDTRINPEDIAQIMKEDYSLASEVISSFTNLGEVITNMYASPESKLEAKLVESSLERIIQSLRHDSLRRTRQSVTDLGKVINNILEGQIHEDTGSFKEFWGRGQQYVSLVRSKFLDR